MVQYEHFYQNRCWGKPGLILPLTALSSAYIPLAIKAPY